MNKNLEPEPKFVEKLEWQLASEYRRASFRRAARTIAVPRGLAVAVLVVGVLVTGVAAIKAADYVRDSWRKKIEVARGETEVRLKQAELESVQTEAKRMETLVSLGLVERDESQAIRSRADGAALDLLRSRLDLEEVKASGAAPSNELSAPLVHGRDYAAERLEIEKRERQLDLDLQARRLERVMRLMKVGLVGEDEQKAIQAEVVLMKSSLDAVQTRLDLRRRFVKGKISPEDVEIAGRLATAQAALRAAQSNVDRLKEEMALLETRRELGLVSSAEIASLQYSLEAAEAELKLAVLEVDILKKIK